MDIPAPPSRLPLFPIRGCILLPGEYLPLNVFEPRYLNMVDDALAGDRYIGVIQPAKGGTPDNPDLEPVGCAGFIASHSETDDGRYLIVLQGLTRFDVDDEIQEPKPYRQASVSYQRFSHDLQQAVEQEEVMRQSFTDTLRAFFDKAGMQADWDSLEQAPLGMIADKVAMAAPFDGDAKQALLEAETTSQRIRKLKAMMELHLSTSSPQ